MPYLKRLNGNIILIKGNHDKHNTVLTLLENNIIVAAHDMLYKTFMYKDKPVKIHMCHYPITYWRKKEHGSYHLHGHMHRLYEGEGLCCDVGWDSWGKPMEIENIIKYCDEKSC